MGVPKGNIAIMSSIPRDINDKLIREAKQSKRSKSKMVALIIELYYADKKGKKNGND